jgi:sulfite reductase alpha subunit-like flavoprotein
MIDPEIERLGLEMAQQARQTLMDILTKTGGMTEKEASDLIAKAVSEIRVY